jgi:hypothetical protein
MPKVNDAQIKVSEPWSPRTRNQSAKLNPISENQGTNRPGAQNPSKASKERVAEGAIVDVVTRNRSTVGDRPFDNDGMNLAQKAGRGRNPSEGGKTMGSFSQKPNTGMNRNTSDGGSKESTDARGQVKSPRTDTRSYPKRGANARGRNSR